MRAKLHVIATILLVVAVLVDLIVWGAAPGLPDVGAAIESSAAREGFLTATYIGIGSHLDAAVAPLQTLGQALLTQALEPVFGQIKDNPQLAMELIFSDTYNGTHRMLKLLHWGAPVLVILTALAWWLRPKKVKLIGSAR